MTNFSNAEGNWTDKRVLVVGGTGFIGSHFVRALIGRGAKVCVTSRNDEVPWRLTDVKGQYEHRVVRLPAPQQTAEALRSFNPEYVYYLAGAMPGKTADTNDFEQNNVAGVEEVFSEASKLPIRSFTLMGTASEYGPLPPPVTEDDEEHPEEPYGKSKLKATRYLINAADAAGITATALRSPATYGPAQGFSTFIPHCILACLERRDFPMSGEQKMDFLYVGDLVDALLKAGLRTKGKTAEIINISNGTPSTLADVARTIADVFDAQENLKIGSVPLRPYERALRYLSIKKAESLLNWKPQAPLIDSVRRTAEWYRDNRESLPLLKREGGASVSLS